MDWADFTPAIKSVVSGLLGIGGIAFFYWQVFVKYQVNTGQRELSEEQRKDRSDLRRRNGALEDQVRQLSERLIEAMAASSGAGACVAQMQRTIILLERRVKELEEELSIASGAFDEVEGLLDRYRLVLAQAKFYLDGCKGCQNPNALRSLLRDIPRCLPHPDTGEIACIEHEGQKPREEAPG